MKGLIFLDFGLVLVLSEFDKVSELELDRNLVPSALIFCKCTIEKTHKREKRGSQSLYKKWNCDLDRERIKSCLIVIIKKSPW